MPSTQTDPKTEKGVPAPSFFTVMISRGLGKVRSFSISSRFLVWTSVMLALYVVGSVTVIFLYVGELKTRTVQSDLVEKLAHETEQTRQALYRARQRLRFLEDVIYTSHGEDEREGDVPGPEIATEVPEEPVPQKEVPEEPVPQKEALETQAEPERLEPPVTIKRLITKRIGGRLSVKFRLVKTQPGRRQLSGYVFIIAENSRSNPPQLWTHPKVALKDGVPIDYKRGQSFKVRNYRIIRGKFFLDPDTETPSLLTILAYDTSGETILKKVFTIEEAS